MVLAKEISPLEWKPHAEREDQWWVPRPETGGYRSLMGERVEVWIGETALRAIGPHERRDRAIETGDGLYYLLDDRLVVRLPGGRPAEPLVYAAHLERGEAVDGTWRAPVRTDTADGLSVWPGESVEIACDVPAGSVLRFQTVAHALTAEAQLAFVVSVDGMKKYVYDTTVQPGELDATPHTVSLPAAGSAGARIGFEVRGDSVVTAIHNPVIGPAEVGTYGARPWRGARPDVIVFLADTFRADNLEDYGGDPALAPELNDLAGRSKRFLNARSTSIWTLPSHASLFTGVHPPQHGAVTPEVTFADELVTIAEHLKANGYRTGAVTDSAYVSRQFGMDQGFEWFSENEFAGQSLERTLTAADEFLDRDDGRPVFLFVHTYRVHMPYRQGRDENTVELDALMARIAEALRARRGQESTLETLRRFVDEYRGLYLDGVAMLDEQVGEWFAGLGERGLFEDGLLVFTSDHGEEFYEHDNRGHKGLPHEEKVRIPLLLHGERVKPGDVEYGASLLDLPPTIAEFCGVEGLDVWEGESLLRLGRERLQFTHNAEGEEAYLSVTDRGRKVIALDEVEGLERGEVVGGFDLERDPGERVSVAGEKDWPGELARAIAPLWGKLSVPLGEAEEVEMSEEMREQLRKLGYGD